MRNIFVFCPQALAVLTTVAMPQENGPDSRHKNLDARNRGLPNPLFGRSKKSPTEASQ